MSTEVKGYPLAGLVVGAVLHVVNRALRPAGLVVRSEVFERVCRQAVMKTAIFEAEDARRERERAQRLSREVVRLRRHLVELDELLPGVGYSMCSRACRSIVDVALGRDVERQA